MKDIDWNNKKYFEYNKDARTARTFKVNLYYCKQKSLNFFIIIVYYPHIVAKKFIVNNVINRALGVREPFLFVNVQAC